MPAHAHTHAPAHAALILPLTPALLSDPTPLLPLLADLPLRASESVLVYFSSPQARSERDTRTGTGTGPITVGSTQLYDILRADPRAHWPAFQHFLSLVYSTLAAAQWAAGRIGMRVDVGFEGREGRWAGRIGRCAWVGVLDGYRDLPAPSFSCAPTVLPCPTLGSSSSSSLTPSTSTPRRIPVIALGGTFDHLHAAHKLLLHLALFLAGRRLIVGIISPALLASKAHAGYVETLERRVQGVRDFLTCLGGTVEGPVPVSVSGPSGGSEDGRQGQGQGQADGDIPRVSLYLTEIHDAYGPTAHDADIQALVISDETRSGGAAVNDLRRDKGLPELEVWCIEVISARRAVDAVQSASAGVPGAGAAGPDADADAAAGDALRVDSPSDTTTSVRAESLAGMDEKTLKEVKMGSTGIRAWLAQRDRDRSAGGSE